jgi:hypothetical protein
VTSSPAHPGPAVPGAAQLQRSTGHLATAATTRMEVDLPWFRALTAQERSWVGLMVQAGIQGFVQWYAAGPGEVVKTDLAATIFGAAPRAMAGAITLQQTVDLVRLSIDVVESSLDDLLDPDDVLPARTGVSRYAREVAFATAEVYARAAEQRGAWDARLEALVVDAVLRADPDETLLGRASALGWSAHGSIVVVLGRAHRQRDDTDLFEEVRRRARAAGLHALCAVQGERLVVVLGEVGDPRKAATTLVDLFDDGPVVVGPVVEDLTAAHGSARVALAAYRAASGWTDAPRPVLADELLPERVLAGDGHARRYLLDEVYQPLRARGPLVETLAAYLASGGSLEGAARALFVHPNTVRYRLRQVAEVTGYTPTQARDAFALEIALVLGRQSEA